MKKLLSILITAGLLLSLAACSQADNSIDSADAPVSSSAPSSAEKNIITEAGAVDKTAFDDVELADYDGASGGYSSDLQAGTLTAGEWNDCLHWTYWQDLFQTDSMWESFRSTWNQQYMSRIFSTVESDGKPIENALVTLSDGRDTLWQARTDNEGKAYLFYPTSNTASKQITAEYGGLSSSVIDFSGSTCRLTLDGAANAEKSLDLEIVFDTTGSMGDELNYLKTELRDVITRVTSENANIPIRLGLTFYRDDGDEYVVRDFDFTNNIDEAIENLGWQIAQGGGDFPEKVNSALDTAINKHSWAENSTKLLFILLDAPPHSDDAQAVAQMATLVNDAAAKGIRVIPVLSSGADKESEYLLRDFAVKTGGTYMFLTDDSGVSIGSHIEPTAGDYEVEKFNSMMVKIIGRYLAVKDTVAEYVDEQEEPVKPDPSQSTDRPIIPINVEYNNAVLSTDEDGALILTFDLVNSTENEYTYGLAPTLLERKNDSGEWERIEMLPDVMWAEIAVILLPNSTNSYSVNLTTTYGNISGDYRLTKELWAEEPTQVIVEFSHDGPSDD